MVSKTSRLDPRTNDPYINRNGKMELASQKEEILQRFDLLVHTQAGTCPLNISYGVDYEWIKNQYEDMQPEQAFLLELAKRFDRKVEPLLANFDITEVRRIGNVLVLDMIIRSTSEISTNTSVSIQ